MADAASLPKSAVLPKTIILNSPIHYDEEKSVVFSRKDSGKSKIINLSNSKEMEFKHMDEIKTEENLETSNGFHWLLNSIKNRCFSTRTRTKLFKLVLVRGTNSRF